MDLTGGRVTGIDGPFQGGNRRLLQQAFQFFNYPRLTLTLTSSIEEDIFSHVAIASISSC